jgi:hypothetical protein
MSLHNVVNILPVKFFVLKVLHNRTPILKSVTVPAPVYTETGISFNGIINRHRHRPLIFFVITVNGTGMGTVQAPVYSIGTGVHRSWHFFFNGIIYRDRDRDWHPIYFV